ncbi:hypothetical protein CBO05C_3266 [Clostridium botulinum B str. Osaka05]|uniref:Uncharacterized protein n=2 Tax=Clostridium botulinum TaxID=1491 RepID=A0A0S6U9M7_CLOBO|nr:hypothetical protein CBO05C_3266 [Clostridium botulinum B str. Osaka05]
MPLGPVGPVTPLGQQPQHGTHILHLLLKQITLYLNNIIIFLLIKFKILALLYNMMIFCF